MSSIFVSLVVAQEERHPRAHIISHVNITLTGRKLYL